MPTKPRIRHNSSPKVIGEYTLYAWMTMDPDNGNGTLGFIAIADKDGNTVLDAKFYNLWAYQKLLSTLNAEGLNKFMAVLTMLDSP